MNPVLLIAVPLVFLAFIGTQYTYINASIRPHQPFEAKIHSGIAGSLAIVFLCVLVLQIFEFPVSPWLLALPSTIFVSWEFVKKAAAP